MQRKSGLLALLFFSVFFTWANPKDSVRLELRDGQKYIVHRVEKSETLASLAAHYGVDESQLLSANPLVSDKVFPGQIIRIPINANKYGNLTVPPVTPSTDSKLPLANSLPKDAATPAPAKVEPSAPVAAEAPAPTQTPVSAPTQDPSKMVSGIDYHTYVAASPTTVQRLADLFFMEPNDIIAINELKNKNIKEGQKVRIPIYPLSKLNQVAIAPTPIPVPPVAIAKAPEPTPVPKSEPVLEKPVAPAHNIYNQAQHRPDKQLVKPTVVVKASPKPQEDSVLQNNATRIAAAKPAPEKKQNALLETAAKKELVQAKVEPQIAVKPASPIVNKPKEIVLAAVPIEKPVIAPTSDSMLMVVVQKQKHRAELTRQDSEYVITDEGSYKVFDYKQTYEKPDVFTSILVAENAINVNSIDQNKGVGNKNTTHVVKLGETIDMIARKYKISKSDIINWNGLLNYRVREGQELIINAERANVSPYERTLPEKTRKPLSTDIRIESVEGIAVYDSRKITRGVYANNIEKGKFVYIVNKDNFREDVARVIGPLPKGTPANVIVILDQETAIELGVEKSWVNIELYFGIINESQTN